jgi:hypothetical protein
VKQDIRVLFPSFRERGRDIILNEKTIEGEIGREEERGKRGKERDRSMKKSKTRDWVRELFEVHDFYFRNETILLPIKLTLLLIAYRSISLYDDIL